MPPAIDDEELDSDMDLPDAIPAKTRKLKTSDETSDPAGDEDEGDGDAEDAEAEDEYQVEKILRHKFSGGRLVYEIKWLGYEDPADMTWEPVGNLLGARDILAAYHLSIGGTPEPSAKNKKVGKRTASDAFDTPQPGKKRSARKTETNGAAAAWQPPVRTWDDDVTRVAAIIESETSEATSKRVRTPTELEGLLEWNNGKKTQHKMNVLRTKCPQRLLDYYEQHLSFV